MSECDSQFTKGRCDGHLGKFPDCVAEALWVLSLDQGTATTEFGDTDWYGYFALFMLEQSETVELDPDGPDERIVIVPAGNYLLRTHSSGAVGYEATGSREEVTRICDEWERQYDEYLDDEE